MTRLIVAPHDPARRSATAVGTRIRAFHFEPTLIERQIVRTFVLLSIVLGLLSSVSFALGSGVALRDMLDIQKLVVVSNQLYVARYVEQSHGDRCCALPAGVVRKNPAQGEGSESRSTGASGGQDT